MYSRAYDKNRPTIPSGYNGTAFSEGAVTPALPDAVDRRPPEHHEHHEHGDHGDHGEHHRRPPEPPCEKREDRENCDCCDCLPAKIEPPHGKKPPLPSIFGGRLFPNGIGSEEILILGLILLVSQSDDDPYALIYLIILLFC